MAGEPAAAAKKSVAHRPSKTKGVERETDASRRSRHMPGPGNAGAGRNPGACQAGRIRGEADLAQGHTEVARWLLGGDLPDLVHARQARRRFKGKGRNPADARRT